VRDLLVSIIDGTLDSLNLVKDLDSLSLVVLDGTFNLVQISAQVINHFTLVSQTVLVITLARTDFILKAPYLPLKVCDNLMKNFEVSFTCLVILDLLTVCGDNTIADFIWGGTICPWGGGTIALKTAVAQLHAHEFTAWFIHHHGFLSLPVILLLLSSVGISSIHTLCWLSQVELLLRCTGTTGSPQRAVVAGTSIPLLLGVVSSGLEVLSAPEELLLLVSAIILLQVVSHW
jgi:hypothetical protein